MKHHLRNPLAIIGVIAAVLVIAVGLWLVYVPPAAAAILYVDDGTVEVDVGQGWMQGHDGMELSQGTKVRTSAGSASVILMEGEVMHLEPDTEIALTEIGKDTIRIKQVLGETWHKITKLSGISTYEVETPTTVATVRGTEFFVKTGAEEDEVAVGEGEVMVGFVEKPTKKMMMKAMRTMRMQAALDQMTEEIMADDDPRLVKFREKYIKHLKRMRMREIMKHGVLVGMAKKQYGVTDENVQEFLNEVDEDKKDEDSIYSQVPKLLQRKAERAYQITKAIKKAKRMMQQP